MERNQTAGISRLIEILDPGSFSEVGAYVGIGVLAYYVAFAVCKGGADEKPVRH